MTGRPTIKTKEIVDQIIADLGDGIPLAGICRREGFPKLTTVYDWLKEDPEFAERYARAREAGYDNIAYDLLHIADDRGDEPASRRVRVETRMRLLKCWDPKRYGDRQAVEHSGPGGAPLPVPQFVIQPVKAKDDE